MTTIEKRTAVAALSLALASAAATPLAQAEPQKPAEHRACFYADNIENYAVANDRLVYLRVGVADVYRLDLMTECHELTFRQNVLFTHTGASSLICSPIDLTIRFRQTAARRVCPVREMRKLTPAEIAALPKGDRP